MWTRKISLLVALVSSGCGSQLTIHLEGAKDLNGGEPAFVKIDVEKASDTKPTDFGPFAFGTIPGGNFAEVPPGTKFYIDIIGCPGPSKTDCPDNQPDTFIARGCTTYFTLNKDDGQDITIIVHDPTDGAKICPPKKPA
jgi:hypothetical protein